MTDASTTFIDPLYINNYLLLHTEGSQNGKKIKRKFNKKKISFVLHSNIYKNYEKDAPKLLFDYIIELRKNKTLDTFNTIGVLSDNSALTSNITIIPPPPTNWDILCLQSDIKEYNFDDTHNNIYWCNTKISNSFNFIINRKNIEVILDILKISKDWTTFISLLNENCKVYSITQYQLSEDVNKYIRFPSDIYMSKTIQKHQKDVIMNNYLTSCMKFLENEKKLINTKGLINLFNNKYNTWSDEQKWNIFPNISLICILSDTKLFFNTLYTFLKLDYPRDKLELVIVDDQDSEKKLKSMLPEDKRIKIVNLTPKNKNSEQKVPLGYKLNMGVKYSTHQVVYHFFDTDVHFINKFKDLVKLYITSNCNCILSYDYGVNKKDSVVYNIPYIGNMLYTKNWWKVCSYDDRQDNEIILLYNFIRNRLDCVSFIPFLEFGFTPLCKLSKNIEYEKMCTVKTFPCSFEKLIVDSIKESFNITFSDE